jgi:hypothetical protein
MFAIRLPCFYTNGIGESTFQLSHLHLDSVQEHAELSTGDRGPTLKRTKRARLKPLVVQPESVAVPLQQLDAVAPTV